jgi:hypothetical protein
MVWLTSGQGPLITVLMSVAAALDAHQGLVAVAEHGLCLLRSLSDVDERVNDVVCDHLGSLFEAATVCLCVCFWPWFETGPRDKRQTSVGSTPFLTSPRYQFGHPTQCSCGLIVRDPQYGV